MPDQSLWVALQWRGRAASPGQAAGKDSCGQLLPVPGKMSNDYSFFFSPVENRFATVTGGMTSRRIYLADYPAKSTEDYRLATRVRDCLELASVTWCRSAPSRLAFSARVFTGPQLPEMEDWSQLDQWIKQKGLSWETFSKKCVHKVFTVSQGESKPAFSYDAPPRDIDLNQKMVWLDGDTIFFSMHGGIYRGMIGGKAKVIHACKKEGSDFVEMYRQLAYNPQERLLVTLRCRYSGPQFKPIKIDAVLIDEGGRIQREIPIPAMSASNADYAIMEPKLSTNGDSWLCYQRSIVRPTERMKLLYGQVGSDTHKEMATGLHCSLRAVGAIPGQVIWHLLEESAGDQKPVKILREEYRFGALS